jgi:hypothetical protein
MGTQEGIIMTTARIADTAIRCWCDWPDPTEPDRTHDEHIAAYDYPSHEVSAEWNVPEPAVGADWFRAVAGPPAGVAGVMATKPRIGRRMRQLRDVVSCMPGCSKRQAMRVAGLPDSGPGSGRELARAIAAGLVLVEAERANLHRCFASERDRTAWHLRRDLLQPGCPAERVAEIAAEISTLDAQRVASWTASA